MERLTDFSLHVSFKGLSRSGGSGWRKEESDVLMRKGQSEGSRGVAAHRMMACSDAMWWLTWAGEVGREWMGWQQAGEQVSLCQLLITLIGVIS